MIIVCLNIICIKIIQGSMFISSHICLLFCWRQNVIANIIGIINHQVSILYSLGLLLSITCIFLLSSKSHLCINYIMNHCLNTLRSLLIYFHIIHIFCRPNRILWCIYIFQYHRLVRSYCLHHMMNTFLLFHHNLCILEYLLHIIYITFLIGKILSCRHNYFLKVKSYLFGCISYKFCHHCTLHNQ